MQRRSFILGTGTIALTGCTQKVRSYIEDPVYKTGLSGDEFLPKQPLSSFPNDLYPADDDEGNPLFENYHRGWIDEPELPDASIIVLSAGRTHVTIEAAKERVEKNRAVAIEYGEYPIGDLGDEAIIYNGNDTLGTFFVRHSNLTLEASVTTNLSPDRNRAWRYGEALLSDVRPAT